MKENSIYEADLLDEHGYPTEEWLQFLRNWKMGDRPTHRDILNDLLPNGLWMPDWCLNVKKPYRGEQKFEIHTGGWSGNEDVIEAIVENVHLTIMLGYSAWKKGGHYYFEFSIPKNK